MIVADIGAGTGYFALPFSQAVQPNGKIWAVDLQMGMLDVLAGKLASFDGDIELLQGTAHETHLPVGSCDLAFLGNIWHELDDRAGALAEVERILIRVALRKADGLKQDAAKLLGWGRNTLTRKMKELGMEDVS